MTELDPEVREFQELARDFAKKEVAPAEIAIDKIADPTEAYTSEALKTVMRRIYEMGLHKLTIPKERGGLGAPRDAARVVQYELAKAGAGIASTMLVASIAPSMIIGFGLDERHPVFKDYVERFIDDTEGVHSSCWAITEPEVGSDIFTFDNPGVGLQTKAVHEDSKPSGVTATREGGGWTIDGAKSAFVTNGWLADFILLMAACEPGGGMHGTGVFLVPTDLDGISKGKPLDKVGLRALNQSEIFFDSVWVPDEMMIMPPGPAYEQLLNGIVTGGNTAVGTLALAVAEAAFEEGLAYAKERVQGGKPIMEHQTVALKMFDAYRWIEASRASLAAAGDLVSAMAARVVACETCMKVTADMVQVLGGYGISKEYTVEKLYRDAKPLCIMDGTLERVGLHAASKL